jgi:hypothetical protein
MLLFARHQAHSIIGVSPVSPIPANGDVHDDFDTALCRFFTEGNLRLFSACSVSLRYATKDAYQGTVNAERSVA